MKTMNLRPMFLLNAVLVCLLFSSSASAQINVRSGFCEDSTCNRRAPSVIAPSGSVSTVTPGGTTTNTGTSCTPSVNVERQACPTGFIGDMTRDITISCPSGPTGAPVRTESEFSRLSCVAEVKDRDEPTGCQKNDGYYYPNGTLAEPCDINWNAGGHPRNMMFVCSNNSWITSNNGDHSIWVNCK